MENKVTYKNRASLLQIMGFAGNNAATNALFIVIGSFFMLYGSEVYGLSTITIGVVMTATRLLDAVTDPIIGVLVDKTNTKIGRFRPWIIAGSILSNFMFILLFSGIDVGSKAGNLTLLIGIYVVWVLGYTFQTSISKAGQNVLTNDPKQRTLLNAISGVYTMLVYVLALSLILPVLGAFGGEASPEAWRVLSFFIVGLQVVLTLMAVSGIWKKDIKENYEMKTQLEKPKATDYIKLFKGNKALQMLIVAASTNKITQSMQTGLTIFFYAFVVLNRDLQSVIPATAIPFMLIATIVFTIVTNIKGRKETFTLTSFIAMIYGVVAIFLIMLAPSNTIWLILVLGINVVFMFGTDLNVIPMIGDAADFENYNNGVFIPGMIGTAFSFIDKVVSSLATSINGILLAALGYVSMTDTEPTSLLFYGILIAYFAFPALGHMASVIAMKYYPIDKEMMLKMHEAIQKREESTEPVYDTFQ